MRQIVPGRYQNAGAPLLSPLSSKVLRLISVFAAIALLSGCDQETESDPSVTTARPVTVLVLEARDFAKEAWLTGSVELYRQEKIGFEVSGRLLAANSAL